MDEVKTCDDMLAWIEWDEGDHTRLEVYDNKHDRDRALEAACQDMLRVCCASNQEIAAIMAASDKVTARERLQDHEDACHKLVDDGHFVPFVVGQEPKVKLSKGELAYFLLQCRNEDDGVDQVYAFATDKELDDYWADELAELLKDEDVGSVDLEEAAVDDLEELYEKTDSCNYYFRRIIAVTK